MDSIGPGAQRWPGLAEVLANAEPFRVRLAVPFRGVRERTGLLLHGPAGWGEFAPFAEYGPHQAGRWLTAAVEAAWVGWPQPRRDSVRVNAIIPAVAPVDCGERAAHAVAEAGVDTLKVKLGSDGAPQQTFQRELATDLARLRAIRASVGPEVDIRADLNGRWELGDAMHALPQLDAAAGGLQYVEQPLADLDALIRLRAQTRVPIAVDESLRLAADPDDPSLHDRLRAAGDYVVVKPTPLGGVVRSLSLVDRIGLPAVVSGAMDTSIGLGVGVALAAALPTQDLAAGLGTGVLLADDLIDEPWLPVAGRLSVMKLTPGSRALRLARDRVPRTEADDWIARCRAAWAASEALTEGPR